MKGGEEKAEEDEKERERGQGGIIDKASCGSLESHIKRLMDISANNSLYWLQKIAAHPSPFPTNG